jgi:hypothetical protein
MLPERRMGGALRGGPLGIYFAKCVCVCEREREKESGRERVGGGREGGRY